jgi:TPP-dependent pyruvate/acetoin dehydrogenase alpha subunit
MGSKSANASNSEPLLRVMADNAKPGQLPDGLNADELKQMYEGMILIRAYDERQKKLQRSGRIGFCVTSTGEEAIQVGIGQALEDRDWIFGYYRQYGMMLYKGVPVIELADHLFGNVGDFAKGRQMPAHYTNRRVNFVSSSSVIGTHLIHAAGAAMAAKYKKDDVVITTYIGDGGTSANDFHSCMTFAGVYKPPLVIFIVNNQYAISQPVSKQCGAEALYLKGAGYGVPSVRVDGNDMVAVYQASKEAFDRARAGEGPTLIELFTYRVGPHSSSDDPTRYRGNESDQWLTEDKDPIARARTYLKSLGLWDEAYEARIWEEAQNEVNQGTTESAKKPEPDWDSLFEDVYAELPPALARQRDELLEKESEFPRQQEGEFPL